MDDKVLGMLTVTIASLKETTSFVILTLITIFASKLQKDEKIKIGGLEVNREYAGSALFMVLCILMFQTLRLFNNLFSLRNQLTESSVKIANFLIMSDPWIFNPFAETKTAISMLSDNLGFGTLVIIWWLGFHTGFSLLEQSKPIWVLTGRLLSLVYLLFGLVTMFLVSQLIMDINTQAVTKYIVLFSAIPVGSIGVNWIYNRLDKNNGNPTNFHTRK